MEEKGLNCAGFITNLETFSAILYIKVEIGWPTLEKLEVLYQLILDGIEFESVTIGKF